MSKPRSNKKRFPTKDDVGSSSDTEHSIGQHDLLALEAYELVEYGRVLDLFNTVEPFCDRLTCPWSFKRWTTFFNVIVRNVFSPTAALKRKDRNLRIPTLIRNDKLMNKIRHLTAVNGAFDVPSAMDWLFDVVVGMAKRHSVWTVHSADDINIHNMTDEEWENNAQRVAEALDTENEFKKMNVFFTQDEQRFVYISSGYICKFLAPRLLIEEKIELEVTLEIAGANYPVVICNPLLCAFPYAEPIHGPAEEIERLVSRC